MSVAERIDAITEAEGSAALVEEYFDPASPFAGTTFLTLGDPDSHPCEIRVDDLLAVSLLDVAFSPKAVRALLDPMHVIGSALAAGLTEGSLGRDLWTAYNEDSVLGPLGTLWTALQSLDGVGPVKAGKLLARKRPRLIPIVDSVVPVALSATPGRYWFEIGDALADEARRGRVAAPGGSPEVPTPRILDAAIWMWGSASENASAARQRLVGDPSPRTDWGGATQAKVGP